MLALAEANKDGKYNQNLKKAESFLRGLQWDEGEGIDSTDGAYGGAGYDSKQRPDMSNTQFFIEALKVSGVAADDPRRAPPRQAEWPKSGIPGPP